MEIMLGEMAAIMDHHLPHHHGPTRPAKAPTWTTLSPTGSSGSSDDAAELFPWSNELKQTLRMRLQACPLNISIIISSLINFHYFIYHAIF